MSTPRTALRLADLVRDLEGHRLKASDLVEASRHAIAEEDGTLRCFEHLAPDESIARDLSNRGPLAGLPIGVKDIFDTADMPTENGSPVFRGNRPRADAALVAMARAAGAVVMGKTVTTELASLDAAVTQNPAAPGHTPGGSSSGSAAGVAAGLVAAAFGSQTGGSVIRPASYCGIAGYKPSFRLLPTTGMKAFAWSLDTAGLFAARVRDVACFAARLTGRDLETEPFESGSGLRVGLYRSPCDEGIDPQMRAAWEVAGRALEGTGAVLVEIEEPAALTAARDAHRTVQGYEASRALMYELIHHHETMGPKVRAILEHGSGISPEAYDAARRVARTSRTAATALFETVDVLLLPSAFDAAPAGLESTGDPTINKLWTLAGNPVVQVPGLESSDGRPLGMSIVARFGRDAKALAIADLLEQSISQ